MIRDPWLTEQEKFLAREKWKQIKKPLIMIGILIFIIAFTVFLVRIQPKITGLVTQNITENVSCVTPVEDQNISTSTILCTGTYFFKDETGNGVIRFRNDNITLDCNHSILIGNSLNNSKGIISNGHNNIRIKNCIVSFFADGITFENGINSNISNNLLINNTAGGIVCNIDGNNCYVNNNTIISDALSDSAVGIKGYYAENLTIEKNNISGNKFGISLTNNPNTYLWRNFIQNSEHTGIKIYESNWSKIKGNFITQAAHNGIDVDSYYCNISYNVVIDANHAGIDLFESPSDVSHGGHNNILNNNITGKMNSAGIYIGTSHLNIIANNKIYNLTNTSSIISGIKVSGYSYTSYGNIIYNNTINNASICLWNEVNSTIFRSNSLHNCNYYDILLRNSSMPNEPIESEKASFENNQYFPGTANYVFETEKLQASIQENSLSYHKFSFTFFDWPYSSILLNYSGYKNIQIVNNNIQILNLSQSYPFNDIYDDTNNKVIAHNVYNYSFAINANQNIIVGYFPDDYISTCVLQNKSWYENQQYSAVYNLSTCFHTDLNSTFNYSAVGNITINISITTYGLVSLKTPTNWSGHEHVIFIARSGNRSAQTNNVTLTVINVPTCGDGSCDANESCSSCSMDCGSCPPPPPNTPGSSVGSSGGGGGGGGGGSIVIPTATKNISINLTNTTKSINVTANNTISGSILNNTNKTGIVQESPNNNIGQNTQNLQNNQQNNPKTGSASEALTTQTNNNKGQNKLSIFSIFFFAFIAVLVGIIMHVTNKHHNNKKREWIKEYIKEAKKNGYNDKQIADQLRKSGVGSKDF